MYRSRIFSVIRGQQLFDGKVCRATTASSRNLHDVIKEKQITFANNPNEFGKLSKLYPKLAVNSKVLPDQDLDDGDAEDDYHRILSDPDRPSPLQMFNKMINLLDGQDLRAALHVFHVEMKEKLVPPIPQMHRVLINSCGRVGYTEKAFELYNDYKSRRFPHNYGLYADLFNACANCPKDDRVILNDAYRKASDLKKHLDDRKLALPITIYNTMIKAFGRLGDTETAFHLVDDMMEKHKRLSKESVSHILGACINDKEAGFRHALLFWIKARQRGNATFNVFAYNALIRIVNECGPGDPQQLNDILIEAMSGSEVRQMRKRQLGSEVIEDRWDGADEADSSIWVLNDQDKERLKVGLVPKIEGPPPSFLQPRPNFGSLEVLGLSVEGLETPRNRIVLLGGVEGFLEAMTSIDRVKPDSKTFSQLLKCVEETREAEELILDLMKQHEVKPDIEHFNQVVKRRTKRGDFIGASAVLEDVSDHGLTPNRTTFKNLALACRSRKSWTTYLKDLKRVGYKPDLEMMTALIQGACNALDPGSVRSLLERTQREELKADKILVKTVEKFYQRYKSIVLDLEKGARPKKVSEFKSRQISEKVEDWRDFIRFYEKWLKEVELHENDHNWQQYLTSKDRNGKRKRSSVLKHVLDRSN